LRGSNGASYATDAGVSGALRLIRGLSIQSLLSLEYWVTRLRG